MMNSVTPTRKRTHLKSSQVAVLQESFNTNPLPDSSVRSRLAQELSVTERTIQIWFQNRRAKARKAENGNTTILRPNWELRQTPPRYQATFRTMMTPERFEELKQDHHQIRRRPRSSSKPEPKSAQLLESIMPNRAMSEGIHHTTGFPSSSNLGQSPTPLQLPLPVSVLRIGSWTRFAQQQDLVCYVSLADREVVWKVQAEGHFFRIQMKFENIQRLYLSQQIQMETGEFVGQIDIETSLPLLFSMWRIEQDQDWVRCGDFTEDKQASVDNIHTLQGNHEAFKQVLLDLISLAPELATKMSVAPELTMSPSATPEPTACIQPHQLMYQPQQKNFSHLMLQAPFFYPTDNSDFYSMMQPNNPMYPSVLI